MKSELIKDLGQLEDIDYIGIIKPEEYRGLNKILKNRRDKGYNTEFENEDFDIRINPMLTMEDVSSIIVIGLNYWSGLYTKPQPMKNRGSISRSSWGEDYHNVVKTKLKNIVDRLSHQYPESKFQCYVDTGPLVDRHLAYKASMGFYGFNNAIINEKLGSWLYIGYILTNLKIEMEVLQEVPNGCGTCNKCIIACPTNALLGDYGYDGTRCISYLTQTKRNIPYELREKMGKSIYGCDICQQVCPYNKDIKASETKAIKPDLNLVFPVLTDLLHMTKKEFNERYGSMSLSWRGKNVIIRNALIAIGNTRDESSIDDLKKLLQSPSRMLREYSAWALARIGTTSCLTLLQECEADENLSQEIERLLEYYRK